MIKGRQIDNSLCDSCDGRFLCVQDCVTSCIESLDGHASFKEKGYCIDCGHCNAICPKNAISSEQNFNINDDFLNFLAMKRTCRHYDSSRVISKEDLELIIQAGYTAPSEKNKPTVRICIIKEQLSNVFFEALEILREHVQKSGTLHPQYSYIMNLYEKKKPVFWGGYRSCYCW